MPRQPCTNKKTTIQHERCTAGKVHVRARFDTSLTDYHGNGRQRNFGPRRPTPRRVARKTKQASSWCSSSCPLYDDDGNLCQRYDFRFGWRWPMMSTETSTNEPMMGVITHSSLTMMRCPREQVEVVCCRSKCNGKCDQK